MAWARAALFAACLLPFARLVYLGFNGGLGSNPVEFVTRSTGWWTLTFLCITLAVTPLRRLVGWNRLLQFRRMLGLFAFFYACLHFATYVWLDVWFDVEAIAKDILKRPFITMGFTAFLLLVPLAVSSTTAMQRRLGRNWQRLHRLVYVAATAGLLHFWWLVKRDITEPAVFAAVLALLLGLRLAWALQRRGVSKTQAAARASGG
jgi:sulfoxide reductase heme-binding subunit YedZ